MKKSKKIKKNLPKPMQVASAVTIQTYADINRKSFQENFTALISHYYYTDRPGSR